MIDQIKSDLIIRMKTGQRERTKTLRMITAAVKQQEVDKRGIIVDNDLVITTLNKMCKQRQESIEAFKIANRLDLIAIEESELAVLLDYLPKKLKDDEVIVIVDKALHDNGITTKTDLGKAMTILRPLLNGKGDMKFVADYVKSKLV